MELSTAARPKISLLYVEDDHLTQETIKDTLLRSFPQVNVLTADTGEAGLEIFRKHSPQIVLTDIVVPGMTGLQMARQIRAMSSSTLMIAATAHNDSEYLLDAISIGVTHFLLKPLDLNSLLQAVREAVNRVEMEQEMKAEKELTWKLSHVVQQSPSGVLVANARGMVEYVNERYVNDTGFAQHEIMGQNLRFIFMDAKPFDNYEMIWSTIRRGFHWRGQIMRRKKSGEFIFQNVCIFPLSSESGTITHYVATMEDVSERKRAEVTRAAPADFEG